MYEESHEAYAGKLQVSQGSARHHGSAVVQVVSLTRRFLAHANPSNSSRKALERDSGKSELGRRDGAD